RPARMLAEVATTDSFKTIHRAVFVDALPETDFTANALIDGLPGAGHLLPHPLPGPCFADHRRRADDGPFSHRAERPALDLVRVVARHRRPRLGPRRSARRPAHLRDHAAQPARFLHPQPRTH